MSGGDLLAFAGSRYIQVIEARDKTLELSPPPVSGYTQSTFKDTVGRGEPPIRDASFTMNFDVVVSHNTTHSDRWSIEVHLNRRDFTGLGQELIQDFMAIEPDPAEYRSPSQGIKPSKDQEEYEVIVDALEHG